MISASAIIFIKILFYCNTGYRLSDNYAEDPFIDVFTLRPSVIYYCLDCVGTVYSNWFVRIVGSGHNYSYYQGRSNPFMLNKVRKDSDLKRDGDFRYLTPVAAILVGIALIFVVYGSF
jgi:hypothetical protein